MQSFQVAAAIHTVPRMWAVVERYELMLGIVHAHPFAAAKLRVAASSDLGVALLRLRSGVLAALIPARNETDRCHSRADRRACSLHTAARRAGTSKPRTAAPATGRGATAHGAAAASRAPLIVTSSP